MAQVLISATWLENLNGHLTITDEVIRKKSSHEKQGQMTLPLTTIKNLAFVAPIDMIIEGPCSEYVEGALRPFEWGAVEDFPMGKSNTLKEDGSWIHAAMEINRPKSVVVYPECCGSYTAKFQKMIRGMFPDTVWQFPPMPDLFDDPEHYPDVIAQRMVNANILAIEQP